MSFINDENGATAIEYGMLSGFGFTLISVVYATAMDSIIAAMSVLNTALTL
tara:strand:+ start:1131 stop:1283 length:153 start_codon:yes stop_codon:yes gene_type:complete